MHNQEIKENQKPINVLLVDNQKLSRKCIRSVLESMKTITNLYEASNGRQALELARDVKPAVVLIKDDLEDMSGTDVCTNIRKANDDLRVILLTSDDSEIKMINSLAAGAHGFFSLNMDLKKLFTAISIVAKGDLWVDSTKVNAIHNFARRLLNESTVHQRKDRPKDILKEALTRREIEVLSLVAEGRSNNDISQELEISLHTTKSHIRNILTKLQVHDRASAADLLKA